MSRYRSSTPPFSLDDGMLKLGVIIMVISLLWAIFLV